MKKAFALILYLGASLPAFAGLLVYEGFDYPAGTDNVIGQNGGTGFTSAWLSNSGSPNISLGTMSYTDGGGRTLITTGNRIYMDATNPDAVGAGTTSIVFRDFNLTSVFENTLYFSIMGEQLTGDARATNFAFFAGANEAISIGHGTNTPAGGPFTWGAFTAGNGSNGGYSSASIFEPAFLVMRIDLNQSGTLDRVRLYVNPSLDAEPAVADVDFTREVVTTFSALTRARPFAGNSNATLLAAQADYDELRIGTTYGDVAPVPEPATAGIIAIGSLLLLGRRKRG